MGSRTSNQPSIGSSPHDRHDQEISGACRRNVGDADRFGAIALHLQVARFKQLDRRRATERFQPQRAGRIDVPARVRRG